jgi:DNA invertase Pin-like site-specific DNA recombinase
MGVVLDGAHLFRPNWTGGDATRNRLLPDHSLDYRLSETAIGLEYEVASVTTAVGYVRVSTEQGNSGLGLEAQRSALREEAKCRGWSMLAIHQDVASGKTRNGRHGLEAALEAVELGEAEVLVGVKIDRLSRSLRDLIELMDRSVQEGWALVTLDLRVDTTTPHGKAMARMAGVFAELERDLIAERTQAALAVKKPQGAKLGRPATLPQDVRKRIERMRARGLGWTAIARELNGDGVATAQGGKRWYPSTVRAMFTARQAVNRRPRASTI